jgi:hypothetical protein
MALLDRADRQGDQRGAEEEEGCELREQRGRALRPDVDRPAHADVVRGREELRQPAEDERHVADREDKAGELHERDAEEHGLLHGLGGCRRGGREDEPERQRDEHVEGRDGDEEERAALRPDTEDEPGDDHHQHDVEREHTAERQNLAEEDLDRGGGRHLELLEGAGEPLVHDGHRGDEGGEEREHEPEGAGDHERLAVEARIEEHARRDRHPLPGGGSVPRGRPGRERRSAGGDDAPERRLGVAGEHRLAAVVDHLDLGRRTACRRLPAPAVEVGRDDERHPHLPGHEGARDALARGDAPDADGAGGGDVLDQAPARGRGARVEHGERQLFDVGGEHVAEDEERGDRHQDECGDGEGVAEGRAHLALNERPEPPQAHPRASVPASTRRKTSFMAG